MMPKSERMVKYKLFMVLVLLSTYALGQNKNRGTIDQAVSTFCECALKATGRNEFEQCGKQIDRLSALKLSKSDSVYLLDKVKSQCGEVFDKFLRKRSSGPSTHVLHTFLDEHDLQGYALRVSNRENNAVKWEGLADSQKLRDLFDYREVFSSDSIAAIALEIKKDKMLSDRYTKLQIQNNSFQSLEVYRFELFKGYQIIQIYARKGTLICFLIVGLNTNDAELVYDLISKVGDRVKLYEEVLEDGE